MTLSQKESASRFQFLKPWFKENNKSISDTSSFETAPFTCLNQGDGNAENELQRLKLDIVRAKAREMSKMKLESFKIDI